jgi:hypothetical protein
MKYFKNVNQLNKFKIWYLIMIIQIKFNTFIIRIYNYKMNRLCNTKKKNY